MKGPLATWLQKFDALSLRERLMVALAALAAIYFLLNVLLIDGWARQNAGMTSSLAEQREESARVAGQLKEFQAQVATSPDEPARARIREIEKKIAVIDATLESASRQLVPPERMATLLEDLLKRNKRLQLVSLTTLPAEALLREKPSSAELAQENATALAAGKPEDRPNIYKHGVELTLGGSYFDMLDYLAQIEALPWQMYWGRLTLDARDYQHPVLTLTLYTLSLDRAWLKI